MPAQEAFQLWLEVAVRNNKLEPKIVSQQKAFLHGMAIQLESSASTTHISILNHSLISLQCTQKAFP